MDLDNDYSSLIEDNNEANKLIERLTDRIKFLEDNSNIKKLQDKIDILEFKKDSYKEAYLNLFKRKYNG
jgi:hypothetical protein